MLPRLRINLNNMNMRKLNFTVWALLGLTTVSDPANSGSQIKKGYPGIRTVVGSTIFLCRALRHQERGTCQFDHPFEEFAVFG